MSFWEFANNSPWLTFFLAMFAFMAVEAVVMAPVKMFKVHARRKNIEQHGWPTPPLDADGDVVLPKSEN